jgi:hypothetical protein
MRALAVAGLVLLVVGVLVLALPVSVDDGVASLDCGSGLTGVAETPPVPDLDGACEDEVALRRVWGWPVAVIGLALVGGAVVSRVRSA